MNCNKPNCKKHNNHKEIKFLRFNFEIVASVRHLCATSGLFYLVSQDKEISFFSLIIKHLNTHMGEFLFAL